MSRVKAPVLVFGWIPRVVATIARSLHNRGIPVDVVDCSALPVIRSNAVREYVPLPFPYHQPDEFYRQLRAFIESRGHDMLFLTDDVSMAAVLEHYKELSQLLHVACPPPEIAQQVLNKTLTLEAAQKCGIRIPRTLTISNSEQLCDCATKIPFPWILKPAEKEKRWEEFTSHKFNSLEEVQQKYPTPRDFTPPVLLQEYCPGVGVGVEVFLHRGECLAIFQHRRLKELLYSGGFAVTAIAESPDPSLVKGSLDLLRALRWEGVAMVEYRVNPANGEAVLMEVNGRYWGTLSLPVLAGINFPLYHWQAVHGERPSVSPARVGMKWRWTAGYIARLHLLLIASRYSQGARKELQRSLLQLPADFMPWVVDSSFSFSDPLLAVTECWRATKLVGASASRALLKRIPGLAERAPVQTSGKI